MKKQILVALILAATFPLTSYSQIIWTDPVFPTPSQAVTVYFDATKGTAGLNNCNCDVYVHAGLITSASNSPSDWKYVVTSWGVANPDWKMTPVSGKPNQYSFNISPSIKAYFKVTSTTEVIQKLAFVFRNGSGTLQGKETGGADIFHNVYPDNAPFSATLITPASPSVFTKIGESIPVKGVASEKATLKLFDNGNLIASAFATELEHNIVVNSGGTHLVEFTADNGATLLTRSFTYVVPAQNIVEALSVGMEAGINYVSNSEAILVLRAPGKQNVFLMGDFNNWQLHTDYQLKKTPDGASWWISVKGLTPGKYYAFQYLVDGTIRIADPYTHIVLDPGNDGWVPAATFPNMPAYPTGKTTGITSVLRTAAPAYNWQVNNFKRPAKENLVIYELLLRDFLGRHDFQTLKDTLDYLVRLGINAIELMPVSEFDGNNSWGYNPTFHNALDKYYGSPDSFKALVDECHKRGIAVILDVVYNHAHEKSPLAMLYWDAAKFRPAVDNPWLNVQAPHDYSVFFDFNHESPLTKEYVEKTLKHWLSEYRVDGFRFDLSKGLTQNKNGHFGAWAYDASRISILKNYASKVWQTSPGAYVIMEHFTENTEEKELSDYGMMLWSGFNVHNQYIEAAMGYPSNLVEVSYKVKGWKDAHLIAYMESHDEERMVYKSLQYGNSAGAYNIKNLTTALSRVELASVFFFTVPGPKMLWQFGELGYDYSINRCPNGSSSSGCRTDSKPIRWDYMQDPVRMRIYNVISSLLHLRNNYEVFKSQDFDLVVGQRGKTIRLNHATMNVTILGNFDVTDLSVTPGFQHTGWWYEYFTGDSVNVVNVNTAINLKPGEYRLYLNAKVPKLPAYTSTGEAILNVNNWTVSPNPSNGNSHVGLELMKTSNVLLSITTLQGQKKRIVANEVLLQGRYEIGLPPDLATGMYLVHLKIDGRIETKKLVVFKPSN